MSDDDESHDCPNSKDGNGHCVHWWDGEACCWCDAGEMSMDDMVEQGMAEGPLRREQAT
jgi:hypothetical protein